MSNQVNADDRPWDINREERKSLDRVELHLQLVMGRRWRKQQKRLRRSRL